VVQVERAAGNIVDTAEASLGAAEGVAEDSEAGAATSVSVVRLVMVGCMATWAVKVSVDAAVRMVEAVEAVELVGMAAAAAAAAERVEAWVVMKAVVGMGVRVVTVGLVEMEVAEMAQEQCSSGSQLFGRSTLRDWNQSTRSSSRCCRSCGRIRRAAAQPHRQ